MSRCMSEFCINATMQFMEADRTDHGSVQSYDPDKQQCVAAASFTVVCEEVGDLIITRLPMRDFVRTLSVCKALRACGDANRGLIHSKYFRRKQLEARVTPGLVLPDLPRWRTEICHQRPRDGSMGGIASPIESCAKPAVFHLSSIQSRIHGNDGCSGRTCVLSKATSYKLRPSSSCLLRRS